MLSFGTPKASGLLGHGLGVLGFLLMVSTETLYSLRKRAVRRPWGRLSSWLKFHIYTGIVGPFLVLLHSAWNFQGLAAVLTLVTGLVMMSGFVGRYIYTAVPRTADGLALEIETLREHLASARGELESEVSGIAWEASPEAVRDMSASWVLVIGRGIEDMGYRFRTWWQLRGASGEERAHLARVRKLELRNIELQRQVATLGIARRLLSIWHTIHIPLGVVLFALASFHIAAALYFATLSK
jgi:hypothetical protein